VKPTPAEFANTNGIATARGEHPFDTMVAMSREENLESRPGQRPTQPPNR